MLEIAVIGGGNGAYAAAADLADQGHRVRWWRRDRDRFKAVLDRQRVVLYDQQGSRDVVLDRASTDLGEVVAGAELIIVPLPATAQEQVARELAPHLEDGQLIFLPPGTFGTAVMARVATQMGCRAEVAFVEAGTLPYLARKHGEDAVAISARATRLPAGCFPALASKKALRRIAQVYPSLVPLRDALDGALMNAGPIIHPPLIFMNAAPLQHSADWDIHHEGTQPAVRAVQDALDRERIAVREALGYRPPHFPLADHYNNDGDEWMYGREGHARLVDSGDWREPIDLYTHRYIREDVVCGLTFLASVGSWADVPTPVADALLQLASVVLGRDVRADGRTLTSCGLNFASREQMRKLLDEGWGVME
ncbi:NAD/NADP octopine/nopaline dehydrogenase family protein [Kyrpidia spormannii]|uniref:Glycerol-3-phosphate dehydrogenase n=1 Tax=Kyrpidia spormannii TaxID=2055160 RepID=A0A6F9EDI5_9BACL|nr:NAD/NADP octopine/nopaline dehydrogenase family protein [Kyrpidia spormannii]CAB3394477.1 Glycerol-3-phosphate dehydrogenase [Kyrpidia spormannii]